MRMIRAILVPGRGETLVCISHTFYPHFHCGEHTRFYFCGMDYEMLVHHIRKHVKYVYDYRIRYNLGSGFGKEFFVERRNIITKAIPAISGDMDMFEVLIEKMFEDGYIIKDDGHTLVFSEDFVFK